MVSRGESEKKTRVRRARDLPNVVSYWDHSISPPTDQSTERSGAKFSIGLAIDNSAKQNQTKIVFSDVSETTAVLSWKKYMWIWSITFFKGCSLCYCDAIYRRAILFARSMNHIPSYLYLSRADDDDVRNNGKCDCRSVLIHPMLSNANFSMENDLLASFVWKLMITVPTSIDHVKRPRLQI